MIDYLKETKHLIIKYLIIFILSFSFHELSAQLISSDQAPPSVKWRQIQESNFNLIYPSELYNEAQAVANILKNKIKYISKDIGIKPRKINIILQNRTLEANGYVQLAPRKSEFHTTPPQESDPSNWVETLAIHEYRHVVQFDKLTGNIRFPFEELGFAFFGVSLPTWFYEGDAVITETLLSEGGRGRVPSWEMNLRANLLEKKNYSYQKNYLGSFKDVTPGHYNLGYFLTAKIQRDYGPKMLDSILSRISQNPLRPYNFSRSLKKLTGFSSKKWHEHTLLELHTIWQGQQNELQPLNYSSLFSINNKFPVSFTSPQVYKNGSLLALKETPLRVSSIVKIDSNGRLQELVKTGRQNFPHFSYAGNKITWDEIRVDGRFKLRSYSVVHIYDLVTKKHIQLTKRSRLYEPNINNDGSRIAAVEINLSNEKFLVILDAKTGKETIRIPSPENAMLSSISYKDDEKILGVTRNENGTGIVEFSLADKKSTMLLNNQTQEIEAPTYVNNEVLFKAHYNGIDNLYILNPKTSLIDQITNVKYGVTDPHYDSNSNRIYFTNYDGRNSILSSIILNNAIRKPVRNIKNTFTNYFKPFEDKNTQRAKQDSIPKESFQDKPYKEFKHLFNFHSISINNGDFDDLENYKPGLFILSNNIMNTLGAKAGITYNPDIHGLTYHAEIQYNRYFPKFSIGYENRAQLSNIRLPKDSRLHAVRWRENSTNFQVELPFSFNRLNKNYTVNFKMASSYINRYDLNNPDFDRLLIKYVKFPMSYQLSVGKNSRYSQLDLAPQWGQNIAMGFRNLPFSNLIGSRHFLQSVFYFPGLLVNHSTQVRFNFQRKSGVFANDNIIPMVSGYDQLRLTQPENTFFLNYKFPFAYPDFEIGSLAYIKRLKANLFVDFEDIGIKNSFQPRTYGLEVRADMNLLRFYLPNFDIGVKAIYINENNPKRFILQYGMQYSY